MPMEVPEGQPKSFHDIEASGMAFDATTLKVNAAV